MRILIVSDAWHPQVNGVVRTYEHLKGALEAKGHTVKVIGPADFPLSTPMPGYAEIRLTLFPYRRLARMIADYAPDALHLATEGPLGWAARRAARRLGLAVTTSYHTQFPQYLALRIARLLPFAAGPAERAGWRYIRRFHRGSDGIFAATSSLRAALTHKGLTAPLLPLTRGVDTDLFHPPRAERGELDPFLGLPRPVALYVGRLAVEKSVGDFLAMDWPGGKALVGDGPERAALEQAYPDALFCGVRRGAALAACYRAADVFVFPSRTDTFGMVLIEAMACGLPIAAYPVMGPVDIVDEAQPALGALAFDLGTAARRALDAGGPESAALRFDHVRRHYGWDIAADQFVAGLTAPAQG